MEERNKLPFRANCEGYFLNEDNKILAKDSGKGYIMFPGGGIDNNEDLHIGMQRETKEETGMTPLNMSKLGVLRIIWGPDWAKTEKQQKRYEQFQGDEMHFFTGTVVRSSRLITDAEDAWQGKIFMEIQDGINVIEKSKPFDESVEEYREMQLRFLKKIKESIVSRVGRI